ncbi:hypothetical protein ACHMXB_17675 [Arthrobacter sp. UC242_113]|uniref:hypothetical protein n=1 Tax=Arthrobacter sp. UC242_113 TaxID=3374550 RepID=UPI003756C776
MILRLNNGDLVLTLHQPNNTPHERAAIYALVEKDSTIAIADGATKAPASRNGT